MAWTPVMLTQPAQMPMHRDSNDFFSIHVRLNCNGHLPSDTSPGHAPPWKCTSRTYACHNFRLIYSALFIEQKFNICLQVNCVSNHSHFTSAMHNPCRGLIIKIIITPTISNHNMLESLQGRGVPIRN